MRLLLAVFLLLLPFTAVAQQMQEVRLGERRYLIALPEGVRSPPLIVALHGGGGGPEQFARSSGVAGPALRAGYAVLFPAGTGRRERLMLTWNAGYCCAGAQAKQVDDVAFLEAVVADARSRFGLSGRAYGTGMSNGSMMVQLWAARHPETFRAIGTVAGTMDADRVRVRGPVPILHIHGTADTHVPFNGGVGPESRVGTDFASVEAAMADFAAPWGRLTREGNRWADRAGRVRMELIAIPGGGHVWPGGRRGGGDSPIDANREILRFFAAN